MKALLLLQRVREYHNRPVALSGEAVAVSIELDAAIQMLVAVLSGERQKTSAEAVLHLLLDLADDRGEVSQGLGQRLAKYAGPWKDRHRHRLDGRAVAGLRWVPGQRAADGRYEWWAGLASDGWEEESGEGPSEEEAMAQADAALRELGIPLCPQPPEESALPSSGGEEGQREEDAARAALEAMGLEPMCDEHGEDLVYARGGEWVCPVPDCGYTWQQPDPEEPEPFVVSNESVNAARDALRPCSHGYLNCFACRPLERGESRPLNGGPSTYAYHAWSSTTDLLTDGDWQRCTRCDVSRRRAWNARRQREELTYWRDGQRLKTAGPCGRPAGEGGP